MKQILALLFILSVGFCNAYCQSVSALSYNSLTTQTGGLLKEKIFVHTDKTFYISGEIIWFKIYCVDDSSHKLIDLSKVAYIELIDSANKAVLQAKTELRNGTGDGSFRLPFGLSSGSYKIRGYTNWMKNEEPDEFFEKDITIINVQKLTVDNDKKKEETVAIRFFPEGGNLVDNINAHIAFKTTNQAGKGIHCSGVLFDGQDSLLSFTDHQSGIGSFYFTPLKNHVYKARIQAPSGAVVMQELPAVEEAGYAMNVSRISTNTINIIVQTKGIEAQTVYLVIHKNKKAVLAKEAALQNNKASFNIDTALLPPGVSTFTVFDAQKKPVCERTFYKKYPLPLPLKISADQSVYDTRKKINISILTDQKNFTVADSANLSMSVYRVDSLQSSDDNTIDTYLNLTSQFDNPVENPQQYLYATDENNNFADDELLLVNGWRKFNSSAAFSSPKPVLSFAPEYNGPIITGKITNKHTGLPQQNTTVYLSLPGKGKQFYTALSDSNGITKWETGNWYGNSKLIVQTSDKDSAYLFSIDDGYCSRYSSKSFASFTLPYNSAATLLQHSIGMQTENIYLGNEMNKFSDLPVDSMPFFVSADKTYRLDDYTRFTTIEEVLREYVELVNVTKRKGDYHFQVYDMSGDKMFVDDPLVLVDGIPYFNPNSFIALDPLKLKKLEVVNRKYFYGSAQFDGILNWHTYTNDAAEIDIDPQAVTIDYEGLQEKREFYSPAYDSEEQINSHLPDFRNVLYWNPNIILTDNNAKQISFFSSDLAGKYVVVLQGVATNGLCSATTTFEVIKK